MSPNHIQARAHIRRGTVSIVVDTNARQLVGPTRLDALSQCNWGTSAKATAATLLDQSTGPVVGNELRFLSLFDGGRGYSFPCDATGHVDLDALSEKARINYFYARAVVGRELSAPIVQISQHR